MWHDNTCLGNPDNSETNKEFEKYECKFGDLLISFWLIPLSSYIKLIETVCLLLESVDCLCNCLWLTHLRAIIHSNVLTLIIREPNMLCVIAVQWASFCWNRFVSFIVAREKLKTQ